MLYSNIATAEGLNMDRALFVFSGVTVLERNNNYISFF